MLARDNFEKNYRRLFSEYRYGTTVWSPLAGGILSGKYNDGNIPSGSRYDTQKQLDYLWQKYMTNDKDKTIAMLQKLGALAAEYGFTQAQLALAWAVANQDVSTCILGFSRLEQVDENLKAVELLAKWNEDIEKRCREILGNDPEPEMDWRKWSPMTQRRDLSYIKQ